MSNNAPSQAGMTLLTCRRLPARLNTEQVALLLGFHDYDISPLMSAGLLKPLGNPASNAPKYFASTVVEALMADERWLDRATRALTKYWSEKNRRKSSKGARSHSSNEAAHHGVPVLADCGS